MKEKKQLTAEEYRALAQQHRQQAASQMKVFLVTGVLVVAMAVALIVAGVAWFANNKEVNLVETGISAMGGPFELACTSQDYARHAMADTEDGTKESVKTIYLGMASDAGAGTAADSYTKGAEITSINKQLVTTSGKAAIRWWMDAEKSDFMDNDAPNTTYKYLEPGTHGRLTFYVIANQEMGEVKLSLKLTGYKLDSKGLTYIANNKNQSSIRVSEIFGDTYADTIERTNHHILFFTNRSQKGSQFQYSGWISDGTFTVDMTGVQKGEAMEVTLYWVWPAYYDQFCYEDAEFKSYGILPICEEGSADYHALLADIAANPKYYFSNFGNGYAYNEWEDITKARIMYNAADSDIGSTNNYLRVTLACE